MERETKGPPEALVLGGVWRGQRLFWAGQREASDSTTNPMGATSPSHCSTACPGFPWISSAPERHQTWQVRLRPPSPQSQCESGGQSSWVPQSCSGRFVSSSSSAGVSPPRSSPVCAKIHSCSPMVPVSLLCRGPRGLWLWCSDCLLLTPLGC